MTFTDLPTGDMVFLDANTLVYHFTTHAAFGPPCTDLVRRIENQDLAGYTSTHILGEVSHRLMTIEAHAILGWSFAGIGNRLRNNPAAVRQLSAFRYATDQVLHSRIQLLTVPPPLLARAAAVCRQVGLRSNDADFDRVPGFVRYAPV